MMVIDQIVQMFGTQRESTKSGFLIQLIQKEGRFDLGLLRMTITKNVHAATNIF